MRIVHLGKYYPPYRGGVETVMESVCRGLAAAGQEVTALVSNDSPETCEEMRDGVRVIRLGRKWLLSSQPICPGLGAALRGLEAEVLHVHLPNPLAVAACLWHRPKGVWAAMYHSDIVRQRLLARPANALLRAFLRRAAAVTVPTPRHVECSEVLPEFADKCRVIHFGIDPDQFAPAAGLPEAAGLLPESWRGERFFLFVGRLVYYKGVEVLLQALRLEPRARCALVGTGPLEPQLRAEAEQLEVANRAAFLGSVGRDGLRSLYRAATALTLPSVCRSEMFGMVQLEAFASGTPVISTDLPSGVPYVNSDGVTGLVVPPGDAGALAAALGKLLDNAGLAAELGARGRARVEAEYDERRLTARYLELYSGLAAGK